MLSNFEIIDLCKYYDIELNGVYMKDEITGHFGNYIINLSNSDSMGSHWTTLILDKSQSMYFDSFGANQPNEITEFVKKSKTKHLAFSNEIIQNLESKVCGYYCIAFLLYIKNNIYETKYNSFIKFINLFKDNTKLNIGVLKNIFKKYSTHKPTHQLILRLYKINI